MGDKTNTFQIVLISVFAVCIIVGVLVFSKVRSNSGVTFSPVTIWGTIPAAEFNTAYGDLNSKRTKAEGVLNVTYIEKRKEDFDQDFIEALARGEGPDAIILSQDLILKYEDKLYPIPYTSLPLRDFKDAYIDEANLYLNQDGIVGIPLFVDPLVLYWNKDLLQSAGVSVPPKLWTEFFTLAEKLSQRDENNNVTQSTIAFGEYQNVTNAKQILSALLLQAGTPIVKQGNLALKSALNDSGTEGSPTESVMNFYTEFSNPSKVSYSWNRSMPESKNVFLSGDSAFYIGFASELQDLRQKNPNLNFDLSPLPQPKDAKVKITYGNLYALATVKVGKDITGTFSTIFALADKNFISSLATGLKVAPARRDLLAVLPEDPDLSVFYNSAIISRAWLDPNVEQTGLIFKNLVEAISSGRLRTSEAIQKASTELDSLLEAITGTPAQ